MSIAFPQKLSDNNIVSYVVFCISLCSLITCIVCCPCSCTRHDDRHVYEMREKSVKLLWGFLRGGEEQPGPAPAHRARPQSDNKCPPPHAPRSRSTGLLRARSNPTEKRAKRRN